MGSRPSLIGPRDILHSISSINGRNIYIEFNVSTSGLSSGMIPGLKKQYLIVMWGKCRLGFSQTTNSQNTGM